VQIGTGDVEARSRKRRKSWNGGFILAGEFAYNLVLSI
jgi:hypothetical protein